MKKLFYLPVFCLIILASCTSGYKKANRGVEYKIFSDGKGAKLMIGNYFKSEVKQMYKSANLDTVLSDSREIMPRSEQFDSSSYPEPYFGIFSQMRAGDSIVLRMLTDSAFKETNQPLPSFMKRGAYLYTTIKILAIYKTQEQYDSARTADIKQAMPRIYQKQLTEVKKVLESSKKQLDQDDKIIKDYLAKNNITAIRSEWGTYVAIHNEGAGDKINNRSIATVNYTGRTLDIGKVFDSNTDPKFQHTEPYKVSVGQLGRVILGWTDGLMQLKKGARATFYIPSTLAYGPGGNPQGGINPNANLVFDIDVLDVIDEDAYEASQKAQMDSIKRSLAPQK